MSDLKMSDVEVVDYPEWTLKDFLPSEMTIINRSGLPDPLSLEIVDKRNWLEVVNVYGEARDAKLVLKALTSHDSHVEQIVKLEREKEMLRMEMVMVPVVLSSYKNPPPKVKDMLARIGEALAVTEPK